MTIDFPFNPHDDVKDKELFDLLDKTFTNPVNPLLGKEEPDRIIEILESLEPFARLTPTAGRGEDILLYFVDEGDGEFWRWYEGTDDLTWVSAEDISQEEIVDALNKIIPSVVVDETVQEPRKSVLLKNLLEVQRIYEALSRETFVEFYEKFVDHITGEEGAPTKEEIYLQIEDLFCEKTINRIRKS